MGDRRPTGEKEYSPLDDTIDLISQVLSSASATEKPTQKVAVRNFETLAMGQEKVVSIKPKPSSSPITGDAVTALKEQEEFVTFKFKVPKSDYIQAKKLATQLEEELGARVDLSNLGRGWLTRLITAEKEILDAARHEEKLKTPNPRNPLEVAEVDHCMTVVQSIAFRRATPIR
jgi:hypothetical protein